MALFGMGDEMQGGIGNALQAIGAGLLSGDRYNPIGPGFSQTLQANAKTAVPKAALKALLMQAGATPEQAEQYSANEKVATLALASLKESKNTAALSGLVNSMPSEDGSPAPVSNLGMGRVSPAAPGGPAAGASLNGNTATSFVDTLIGKESGGNPTAKNPNSSATGLTQFTDRTWRDMMRLHPDLGLTPDGRTDPTQARAAALAYAGDNAAELAKSGHDASPGNLYLGHFLGGPGATRFLNGLRLNPNTPAASYVDPGAVSANRSLFFTADGTPKTAQAFYNERTSKFGSAAPTKTADASGAVPLPAPAASDRTADMPVPDARPAGFVIPGGGPAMPGVTPTAETAGSPAEQAEAAGVAKQAVTVLQQPIPEGASPANRIAYARRVKSWAEKAVVAAPLFGEQGKGLSDLAKSRLDEANKVLSAQHGQPFTDAAGTTWQVGPDNQWRKLNEAEKEPEAVRRLKEARTNWRQYNLPDPNSTDPADQAVWRSMSTKALTGVTTDITNNVGGAEKTYDQGQGKAYSDLMGELQTAGRNAPTRLANLNEARRLLDTPGFVAGIGTEKFALPAKQLLAKLGGDPNAPASMEQFRALSNKAVTDALGGSLGAGVSNADVAFLQRQNTSLDNSIGANKQLIDYAARLTDRQRKVADFARDYAKNNGGRLDIGFDAALSRWADANPVFPEAKDEAKAAPAGRGLTGREQPAQQADPAAPMTVTDRALTISRAKEWSKGKSPEQIQRLKDGLRAKGIETDAF
jgi:hypothetical protein